MTITLQLQESIQKKLKKLIKQGKQLSEEFFDQENNASYSDKFIKLPNLLPPPSYYSNSVYKLRKWQKQCLHLINKLPLQNTGYFNDSELLTGKKDEKGREIYLTPVEIQEITINLEAILEDLKDGIFENLFLAIEVQSVLNHIEQAEELFDEDEYILAGLISLFSLESLLTELCREILKKDETMPGGLVKKSNFLKGKNFITKSTNEEIKKLAKTRNFIAHEGDEKVVSKDEVKKIMSKVKSIVLNLMPND